MPPLRGATEVSAASQIIDGLFLHSLVSVSKKDSMATANGSSANGSSANGTGKSGMSNMMNKLKGRLPVPVTMIYTTIVTAMYPDMNDITADAGLFLGYYLFLCCFQVGWDLYHATRAWNIVDANRSALLTQATVPVLYQNSDPSAVLPRRETLFSKCLFCLISIGISLPLFVVFTSMASFGLPLRVMWNMSVHAILITYGIILPVITMLNAIESVYWGPVLAEFTLLEAADNANTDSSAN